MTAYPNKINSLEFLKLAVIGAHFFCLTYVLVYFQIYGPTNFIPTKNFEIYAMSLAIIMPIIYTLFGFNFQNYFVGNNNTGANIIEKNRIAILFYSTYIFVSYLNSVMRETLIRMDFAFASTFFLSVFLFLAFVDDWWKKNKNIARK